MLNLKPFRMNTYINVARGATAANVMDIRSFAASTKAGEGCRRKVPSGTKQISPGRNPGWWKPRGCLLRVLHMSVLRASPYIACWRQRYQRGKLAPVGRVPVRHFHSNKLLTAVDSRIQINR